MLFGTTKAKTWCSSKFLMNIRPKFFYTFIFVLTTIIFYQIDVTYMKEKKLKETEEKSKEMSSTIIVNY